MPGARFDRRRITALLDIAGETLPGEWLLIGSAAAAAWFSPHRTTDDFELINIAGAEAEMLAAMGFAAENGIPFEAMSSVEDFHLRRIDHWQRDIAVLHKGSRATIYRPNATLFILLKLRQLGDTDLADCVELIAAKTERLDASRLLSAINALPATDDPALETRRSRLVAAIP
jgi:hypothetical protein